MLIAEFWRSRRGNFAMMLALALPVVLGGVGMAVDYSAMTKAKARLQDALDAAVLASSRISDKELSREEVFHSYLNANLLDAGLKNLYADIDFDQGVNYIDSIGTANADVELMFGFLYGGDKGVSAQTRAYEAIGNLEVVLALDNTGSMGEARMAELRKAATSLVDILAAAHSPDTDPKREVSVALVPFVTAVNVKGTGFKDSWIDGYQDPGAGIDREPLARYHGANFEAAEEDETVNHFDLFSALGLSWKGCVEARPAPYHLSDAAPDPLNPDTLFVPYFAPDEPGSAKRSSDSPSQYNNSYLDDVVGGSERSRQRSIRKYDEDTASYIVEGQVSLTNGPNYACPTPIVPLSTDFATLKSEIASMIHWNGSGTNVSEGLAWAMRVLSPEEPYTQGVAFGTENYSKFVVVFTDGENNVFGASSQSINKSDYGSYSFVDQGRIDTDRGRALSKVNQWTLDVCTALKAQNVEIFTVLLGADTEANRQLYSACATTAGHYYPTSDVSELDRVFKKIASKIAKLYVSG